MESKTYIAVTVGPIIKTLLEAKRTRAIWAASYFFSWFIRTILEKAMDKGLKVFLPDTSLMTRVDGKFKGIKGQHGAGLYADRLYFIKENEKSLPILYDIVNETIESIINLSNNQITGEFLNNYLNIHILEKEIDKNELKDSYPLAFLNDLLDNKELNKSYNFELENNYLQTYFINSVNRDQSFLAADAFDDNNRKFRSISEIATTTLTRKSSTRNVYEKIVRLSFKKNEDIELIDKLIEEKIDIRPYQKYFAVLYADGDDIGKLLKETDEMGKSITDFSKSLFEFGLRAEQAIFEYGGNGIYLGGEDILTFLPVACVTLDNESKKNNIFSLIKNLDLIFEETVQKFALDNNLSYVPTLSFGLMMAYFKHPLKEVMRTAYNLLDVKAKSNNKNAIALKFQKHSGQYFECKIEKQYSNSLKSIYALVDDYTNNENESNDDSDLILSSIIQRFKENAFVELYMKAAESGNLDAFFVNFFNEDVHKTTKKAAFLKSVKFFSEVIINDYKDAAKAKDLIYTILRYIHFINSDKEI